MEKIDGKIGFGNQDVDAGVSWINLIEGLPFGYLIRQKTIGQCLKLNGMHACDGEVALRLPGIY